MSATALEFEGIERSFFGVRVLKGISFALPQGETLGLVGENGAGKSTLMNILGGNLPPDAGRMRLFGQEYAPRNPREAAERGVAFIHQELNLFPNLSIAENLFLSGFPRRFRWLPLIDPRQLRRRARQLLERVGLEARPDTPVEKLSPGERQLVEIAKALGVDARLIILDEPTTSLTSRETERLFTLLGQLQEQDVAMIYISHTLPDVIRLCHRIVVLRDGERVGAGRTAEFTLDSLISLMVGRNISHVFPPRRAVPSRTPALELRGVSQPGVVERVSFTLHRGEVLGISGLMGSGRTELARIVFGLDPHARGEIRVNGVPLARAGARERIRRGMAFLTEDRREEGLCMEASIRDNLALVSLPSFARGPLRLIEGERLRSSVRAVRDAVRLTPSARDEQPVKTLSGGNQQKAVLGKWLMNEPSVFILDEPTRGIDIGAKTEVYQLIDRLAERGAGVLVISSEIEELIGLCDRILVMRHGEIRDELGREQFDRERVLRSSILPAAV